VPRGAEVRGSEQTSLRSLRKLDSRDPGVPRALGSDGRSIDENLGRIAPREQHGVRRGMRRRLRRATRQHNPIRWNQVTLSENVSVG